MWVQQLDFVVLLWGDATSATTAGLDCPLLTFDQVLSITPPLCYTHQALRPEGLRFLIQMAALVFGMNRNTVLLASTLITSTLPLGLHLQEHLAALMFLVTDAPVAIAV
jgi:hypothetical protein